MRVQDGWTTSEAELQLQPRASGLPMARPCRPARRLKAAVADQPRVQSVSRGADEPGGVRWTVVLEEPSDDDPRSPHDSTPLADGKRAAVGPFVVRGAARQTGSVLVSASARDARLIFHPQPELTPRDLTDEERHADPTLTAAYDYAAPPSTLPWLEVEAGSVAGPSKRKRSTPSPSTCRRRRDAGMASDGDLHGLAPLPNDRGPPRHSAAGRL